MLDDIVLCTVSQELCQALHEAEEALAEALRTPLYEENRQCEACGEDTVAYIDGDDDDDEEEDDDDDGLASDILRSRSAEEEIRGALQAIEGYWRRKDRHLKKGRCSDPQQPTLLELSGTISRGIFRAWDCTNDNSDNITAAKVGLPPLTKSASDFDSSESSTGSDCTATTVTATSTAGDYEDLCPSVDDILLLASGQTPEEEGEQSRGALIHVYDVEDRQATTRRSIRTTTVTRPRSTSFALMEVEEMDHLTGAPLLLDSYTSGRKSGMSSEVTNSGRTFPERPGGHAPSNDQISKANARASAFSVQEAIEEAEAFLDADVADVLSLSRDHDDSEFSAVDDDVTDDDDMDFDIAQSHSAEQEIREELEAFEGIFRGGNCSLKDSRCPATDLGELVSVSDNGAAGDNRHATALDQQPSKLSRVKLTISKVGHGLVNSAMESEIVSAQVSSLPSFSQLLPVLGVLSLSYVLGG